MAQDEVLLIAKKYADAVRKMMAVSDVILYGSYAKGSATDNSDIDIAVIVKDAPKDYLRDSAMLWSLSNDVDDKIEPVLIVEGHDASGFLNTVMRTGIAV